MRFTFYSQFFGLGMSVDHVEKGPPKKNNKLTNPKSEETVKSLQDLQAVQNHSLNLCTPTGVGTPV